MGRVEACRICLITDVKMDRIEGSLETNFKSVFGHNVLLSADMPDYCCYECSALIYKFNKFRKKYFTSQGLLFNILQNHGVITEREIKKIDRQASNLASGLSRIINIEQPFQDIKIECDPMADELEMTIDDEMDNSGSDDDVPLHSMNQIEHVNVSNMDKKQNYASKRKSQTGESSNKMRKSEQNKTINTMLKDFGVTSVKSRTDANGEVYILQADEFEDELPDMNDTREEYNHSSSEISLKILENQNLMLANQHTILSKLSDISTGFQRTSNSLAYRLSTPKTNSGSIITNKEQLDEFEKNLGDPEKRQMLWDRYTMLFNRRENGFNCAYILIDSLFCRKFMTQCSWSGGSRGHGSKIPLKIYNNFITFFHEIIHECDNSFSLLECHRFIKLITRNALKRSESKMARMSAMKRRQKRTVVEKSQELHNMEAT